MGPLFRYDHASLKEIVSARPSVRLFRVNFERQNMTFLKGKKLMNNITNNEAMLDDEEVASDIYPGATCYM